MKKFKLFILNFVFFLSCQQPTNYHRQPGEIFQDTVFIEEGQYLIKTMKDGLLHGRCFIYDTEPKYPGLVDERFYLDGELLIEKTIEEDTQYFGYKVYYSYKDSLLKQVCSMVYDKQTLKQVDLKSAYYEVLSKERVKYGEPYELKIAATMGLIKNFDIKLKLGTLSADFVLSPPFKEYYGKDKVLTAYITDYKKGINILTGKISFHSEKLDKSLNFFGSTPPNTLLFYHQFEVVDSL